MELQKFIRENNINEYDSLKSILESKPFNLKIKEDNDYPHLFLIYNNESSDFNLKIVKECNGIILEKSTLNILCYTFDKCTDTIDFPVYNFDLHNLFVEKSIEGTLVRLFFDKKSNAWLLSTKKCIDASKSKWLSNKSFDILFNDCIDFNDLKNFLDINICYSFIITHPENNMVVTYQKPELFHISSRDMNTLEEIFISIGVKQIKKEFISKDSLQDYLNFIKNDINLSYEGYIFIDTYYNRWKIKTPLFTKVKNIWGNTNNRFYHYLELRKNPNLLKEYLYYFKNDTEIFKSYELIIDNLINKIVECYIHKHINKTIEKIPFYFGKIIYKLHGDFYKDKIKTDFNKVSLTLLNMDSKLVCYMVNNLGKEESMEIN
jgi:hypothetical protein